MKKPDVIRVGIVGGAGYTGGELIRILLHHPYCKLSHIYSNSQAGREISEVHEDLVGDISQRFESDLIADVDLLFLCMGHGESQKFLKQQSIKENIRIIDLSADFRYKNSPLGKFVYGLPELNRTYIRSATYLANPGCFATAIQLALLPLANSKLLNDNIHISAVTGSTGAGKNLSSSTHFSWRSANISIYNPFQHRHLREINKTLNLLQPDWKETCYFLPFRGDFTRGIFCACYTRSNLKLEEAKYLYRDYYKDHPFIVLSDMNPSLKQVINTNKCILFLEKQGDLLLIISIIDNLIKGASGQGIQNMNLMYDLDEHCGLQLKPVGF